MVILSGRSISPKGNQAKWFEGEYFFKSDLFGGEAITEYLISLFLEASSVPSNLYIRYRLGVSPSISKADSYKPRYGFIPFDYLLLKEVLPDMYPKLYNSVLSTYPKLSFDSKLGRLRDAWVRKVWHNLSIPERVNFVAEVGLYYLNIPKDFTLSYLRLMSSIDLLFYNYDRHYQNFGFMYDNEVGSYIPSKLFDNGMALGVGLSSKGVLLLTKEGYDSNLAFQPFASKVGYTRKSIPLFEGLGYTFSFSPKVFAELLIQTSGSSLPFVLGSPFWKVFYSRLASSSFQGFLTEDLFTTFKEYNLL